MSKTWTKKAWTKQSEKAEKTAVVRCEQCGDELKLHFPYKKSIIELIKQVPNRRYAPEDKTWVVKLQNRSDLEKIFTQNGVQFEYTSTVLKMKNSDEKYKSLEGEKSSYFDPKSTSKTTIKLELIDERNFVVRYLPKKPSNQVLTALSIELYVKILNKSGRVAGKYLEKFGSWTFPLDHYFDFVNRLKSLELRNEENLEVERLPSGIETYLRNDSQSAKHVVLNIPQKMQDRLYPFQREGVEMIVRKGGRAILADEMGLGKTIQALAVAAHFRDDWPLCIISPSSVKFNWLIELSDWLEEIVDQESVVVLYNGKDVKDIQRSTKVVITSYELCASIVSSNKHIATSESDKCDELFNGKKASKSLPKFGMVILDESHYIKTEKAKRAVAARKLCDTAQRVLCLSGTPALAKPIELHNQIMTVRPQLFPNRHSFGQRFCAAVKTNWGWNYSGSCNMPELKLILNRTILIRRLKSEVLKQLPPKLRKIVYLKVPDSASNRKANKLFSSIQKLPNAMTTDDLERAGFNEDDLTEDSSSPLKIWNTWYSETGKAKIKPVLEYILEKLDNEDEKLIIFAHHLAVIHEIDAMLTAKKYGEQVVKITGATPSVERTDVVEQFQNNSSIRVALLSITAANMGITLTAATSVLFAELHYTPGIMVQAEDRAHRIGRVGDVNIEYLIATGTADDWIWSLIRKKLDTLEEAGLGNSASHVTTVTHVSAADEEEDWDNDDFFIDCVVTTQGEEKGNPAQIKNEPDEEVIKKIEKLETVSDQPAKKIKTSFQPRIEKPSFRETVKIKTSPKKAKRKSNSLVQNSKKKLKKSVNNALDELADTGGFKF